MFGPNVDKGFGNYYSLYSNKMNTYVFQFPGWKRCRISEKSWSAEIHERVKLSNWLGARLPLIFSPEKGNGAGAWGEKALGKRDNSKYRNRNPREKERGLKREEIQERTKGKWPSGLIRSFFRSWAQILYADVGKRGLLGAFSPGLSFFDKMNCE